MLKKIDAFQMRCLRRILRIPSTFIDRRNPNRVVLQRCTEILYQNQGDQREFENFLANLITAENPDYEVMYLDLEMKIPCVKFHSNLAVQLGSSMGRNELVARGKIVCIRLKKHVFEHFIRGYEYNETVVEDTRIYIMQP